MTAVFVIREETQSQTHRETQREVHVMMKAEIVEMS